MYAEASQDLEHALHGESSHKHLGRYICENLKQRGRVEVQHNMSNFALLCFALLCFALLC